MPELFTDEQIDQLTTDVNAQLNALGSPDEASMKGRAPGKRLEAQRQAIARATGEDAGSFLARFHAAVRQDLCVEGGVLHAQWKKYRDLASKDMLKTFGGILVGLGLAGNTLIVVVVAVSVYVLYLGVEAFCAGTAQA